MLQAFTSHATGPSVNELNPQAHVFPLCHTNRILSIFMLKRLRKACPCMDLVQPVGRHSLRKHLGRPLPLFHYWTCDESPPLNRYFSKSAQSLQHPFRSKAKLLKEPESSVPIIQTSIVISVLRV